jgi:hypothetical protein
MKQNTAQKPKAKPTATIVQQPNVSSGPSNARNSSAERHFKLGKDLFNPKASRNKKSDPTEKDLQDNIQNAFKEFSLACTKDPGNA